VLENKEQAYRRVEIKSKEKGVLENKEQGEGSVRK